MSMDKEIRTVWVDRPPRGPGGHFFNYMAYREGEEVVTSARRGWGQTAAEAVRDLEKTEN